LDSNERPPAPEAGALHPIRTQAGRIPMQIRSLGRGGELGCHVNFLRRCAWRWTTT